MVFEWIKIQKGTLKTILDNFRPKIIHPESPEFPTHWQELRTKMIDGVWVEQFGQYRYVTGRLGFFGVFGRMEVWTEDKTRVTMPPDVRDLDWHRAYHVLVCDGFSGFIEDENVTCDYAVKNGEIGLIRNAKRLESLYKANGQLKRFVHPLEYLLNLHDDPKGKPLYYNDAKNIAEAGSRGGGKMAPLSTPILTEGGWKTMGDMFVGEKVYGRNGQLTNVTAIHPQGLQPIWKVYLHDGRVTECGGSHLWTVKLNSGIEKIISTEEMYNSGLTYFGKKGDSSKYRIPNCEPIRFPEKELPIDPYILGYLLGNGTLTTQTPKVASSDEFVINEFRERLPGFELAYDESTTNNYTIVDRNKDNTLQVREGGREFYARMNNRLTTKLKEFGLNKSCKDKFIPEIYKTSSEEQRMELLRGLIDSDGSIGIEGSIEFTNTNLTLIQDVADVCRSLGIRCLLKEDNRAGQPHNIKGHVCERSLYYRLFINTSKKIAKLPRKLERLNNKKYQLSHDFVSIVKIEKSDIEVEQQCITVDNEDHTYLTNDFIVTHNSYFIAIGEILYDICFDGQREYIIGQPPTTKASIEVTSSGGGKATELLEKVVFAMKSLDDPQFPELGVWSAKSKPDYEPCPFWKFMSGSISANNKENPWSNTDVAKIGGKWDKDGIGTGSVVYNTAYANNQVAGGLKSAGGRRTRVIHEESGLNLNLLEAWASNEGLVKDGGSKMASQKAIGTSGEMTAVVPMQKIFTHPRDYDCLVFQYPDQDADGEYGFFIPIYMTDSKFKDADGNTDVEKAKAHHLKDYEEKASASDPNVFIKHRMNFPIHIDDMWYTGGTNILPALEAEMVEKQLMKGNLYEKIGTAIKLKFDSTSPYGGVSYEVDTKADPIYDFPFNPKRDNFEGCVMMYINPDKLLVNGVIPRDMCIVTHDGYVSDESGASLGAAHVWVNPKYIPYDKPGNCLAATYIGKNRNGVDGYNLVLEMLCAFYGNPLRGLWYEADRGDKIRSHFLLKNKSDLLCLRPKYAQGDFLFDKSARTTGFLTGTADGKRSLVQNFGEWLLKPTTLRGKDGEPETMTNIERIPCIFTLRQIKLYSFKKSDNFDAISSAYAFPLALDEQEHYIHTDEMRRKNPIKSLSTLYTKQIYPNGKRIRKNQTYPTR